MPDRTVENLLAEWRAAEAERELRPGDIALDEYIARLRDEYHAAVEERRADVGRSRGVDPALNRG